MELSGTYIPCHGIHGIARHWIIQFGNFGFGPSYKPNFIRIPYPVDRVLPAGRVSPGLFVDSVGRRKRGISRITRRLCMSISGRHFASAQHIRPS